MQWHSRRRLSDPPPPGPSPTVTATAWDAGHRWTVERPGLSWFPSENRAPLLVGATGFEPATTCTPSGPGSRATIIRASQRCGFLRTSIRRSRPRIPRIHYVSQKFCYQFATADRAAPHGPPGREAARGVHRNGLQMGRHRRALARPHREHHPHPTGRFDPIPHRTRSAKITSISVVLGRGRTGQTQTPL